MFAKLLKHELRSSSGVPLILNLSSLGVAVLGGIVLRVLISYGEDMNPLAMMSSITSLFFFLLAMVGCAIATEIMMLVRFYKHKFTDQGYLTFTLPVNSHQIFLSSFISILLWVVISSVVLIGGLCIFCLIGFSGASESMEEILEAFAWLFDTYDAPSSYTVVSCLQTAVDAIYTILLAMTSITLGAVIAKKLKVLVAIGLYYGISFISGIITTVISYSVSFTSWFSSNLNVYYDAEIRSMVLTIVWEVILIIAGYIVSTQLMKKKLNLP